MIKKIRAGVRYGGDVKTFIFAGDEEREYNNFKSRHICPDRKPHDNIENDVSLSCSGAGGIGTNTYVTCNFCGCMQEITDYAEW